MRIQLIFIAIVLLTTPLVWALPRFWHGKLMMATTLIVLAWFAPLSLLTMLIVALIQWLLWRIKSGNFKRLRFLISVCLPLLILVAYKMGHRVDNWLLPLGLSYYAFRQIHVAFEYYKGQLANITLEEYFQYLLFLPVILIGPIHRINEMNRSLRRLKWQPSYLSEGLERLLYGMVKINFLGNYLLSYKLLKYADNIDIPRLKIYLKVISFTGNAYIQFSGYSDIAIGLGLIWGIRIMENFNYPFLATNMQDFWRRWHISLSGWCRDYIFQPIVAFSRTRWLALVASMLVLALWHDLSWNYIIWGTFHSLLILLTILFRKNLPVVSNFVNYNILGRWLGRIWVFHLFAFSCLFIMAKDFYDLKSMLNVLFT